MDNYARSRVQTLARHNALSLEDCLSGFSSIADITTYSISSKADALRFSESLTRLASHSRLDLNTVMMMDDAGLFFSEHGSVWSSHFADTIYSEWVDLLRNVDNTLRMYGPFLPVGHNEQEIVYARTLLDTEKKRFGALAVRVSMSDLERKIRSSGLLSKGGRLYALTDAKGKIVLASPCEAHNGEAPHPGKTCLKEAVQVTLDGPATVADVHLNGVDYMAATAVIGQIGWRFHVLSPVNYEIRINSVLFGAFSVAWLSLCAFVVMLNYQSRQHSRYKSLSELDHLTGAGNRLAFEQALEELNRKKDFPVCLVIMDVDGLKLLNDTLGHKAGDALLRRTTLLLQTSLRENDFVYRIGGDEFALIIPNTSYEMALPVIDRVTAGAALLRERTNLPPVHISIGLAEAADKESLSTLFSRADQSMYENKDTRRAAVRSSLNSWLEKHPDAKERRKN